MLRGLNALPRAVLRIFSTAAGKPSAATVPRETPARRALPDGPGLAYFVDVQTSAHGRNSSPVEGCARDTTVSSVESMRRLSAELAAAERSASIDNSSRVRSNQQGMLTDSYGRHHNYLRISLTERCNLRCIYCMPEDGVNLQPQSKMLSTEEILQLAAMFVHAGVDKIRLTGGEPLIRKDLQDIIRALSSMQGVRNVGITTNAINLQRKLPGLRDAGLTHINVSLDTLRPDRFAAITRRKGLDSVLSAVDAALVQGYGGRLKVNCVVMRGVNADELPNFLELTRDQEVDVRFIEWMPFDDNGWKDTKFFSYKEMMGVIRERYPSLERSTDSANDTTKWYRAPGHVGRVGFITSMSDNFCGSCNRLRITSDGNLKVCLFGDESLSLRDALRGGLSHVELFTLIKAAVLGKHAALGGHGDMYGIVNSKNRPMTTIGG